MIRRNKSDRTIGPTVPAKIARNQSCIDTLQGAAEVSLQQLAESRSAVEGKKLETLDAGFLDFLFPCCCGLLSVVSPEISCAVKLKVVSLHAQECSKGTVYHYWQ